MPQLSDDCFAFGGPLLGLDEVRAFLARHIEPVAATAPVALLEADNRVLAADVVAQIDVPPFDNSAVDGYAVRYADLATDGTTILALAGRIAAGATAGPPPPGAAVRIFTGAPMPQGFDTVFMQEDVTNEGGRLVLPAGLKRGANRRLAGEDTARGRTALCAGRRLTPRDLAILAGLGLDTVEVRARLRVALFSTGDEIVSPGVPLRPATLYDANRFMLAALLNRLGCAVTDLGILPDRREALAAALAAAAAGHDLILTSGGVSTGGEDHVKAAVEDVGSLSFWRIAIKPGRPLAMGVVGGAPFIGLPGNPAAVFVTFVQVARPLVARLSGEAFEPPTPLPVTADFRHRKRAGRREYVRARLVRGADGRVLARKHPREGAGMITSLTETDGLVELPEDVTSVEPGATVGFIPYAVLL